MAARAILLFVAIGFGFALGGAFERFNAQDRCLDRGGAMDLGVCMDARPSG